MTIKHVPMKTFYWPGHEPEGVAPMLELLPGIEEKTPEECVAICEEHWKRGEDNAILLRMGNWNDSDGVHHAHQEKFFMADAAGNVTVESVANHVRRGMIGWERWVPQWTAILEAIDAAGFTVGLIAADLEAGKCTRNAVYRNHDEPEITMLDVIEHLYTGSQSRLPKIDVGSLRLNEWDIRKGGQTMCAWNDWVAKKHVKRWERTILGPAKDTFGSDVMMATYDYSRYVGTPMFDPNGKYPRPSYATGGTSCPVLYIKDDEYFRSVREVFAALRTVKGPTVAWSGGLHRVGTKHWLHTAAEHKIIVGACGALDHKYHLVF